MASSHFTASQRLSQFLRYVVEQTISGQSDHIKQYTVAVEGLGYGAEFDPQSSPNVRVHARQLRRTLEQYYHTEGVEDPIRIDIPSGGYVPVFSENHSTPVASKTARSSPSEPEPMPVDATKPTIAVVTFECLNAEDETDYIATGLTEEIIVSLTHFPDFMAVGPLFRNVIREEKLYTRGISEKYGVRFVLDGSIRTDGRTLRMTVRLTDAVSGQNLWGQSLKCDLEDLSILACENNVVNQVAAAIGDDYGVIPLTLASETFRKPTENPTAYEAILRVYHYLRCLTDQAHADAVSAPEKALQHDPDNAKALALLGDLFAVAYQLGFATTAELDHAEAMIRKAVALDPNTQVTRYPMVLVHFVKFQRELYMAEAEQVLRLNPNHALYLASVAVDLSMMSD